jgi:hypothetical protein
MTEHDKRSSSLGRRVATPALSVRLLLAIAAFVAIIASFPMRAAAQQPTEDTDNANCSSASDRLDWNNVVASCSLAARDYLNDLAAAGSERDKCLDMVLESTALTEVGTAFQKLGETDRAVTNARMAYKWARLAQRGCSEPETIDEAQKTLQLATALLQSLGQTP